ncbi:MAG: hypothetical protein WCA12_15935, partial [Burkholderiales bacterium]
MVLQEDQGEVFYHWKGTHPHDSPGKGRPTKRLLPEVEGYGTFEFSHAAGPFKTGKGHFLDVALNVISTAQRKDVQITRVLDKDDIDTMTNGCD